VHWERLKQQGKIFENGTIFTVRDWHHKPDRLDVTLIRTRYDHYLYKERAGKPSPSWLG
jgi:hypothetical protein